MQETTNYNFKKLEGTDKFNVSNYNDNFDVIDTKLKKCENSADQKSLIAGTGISIVDGSINVEGYEVIQDTLQTNTENIAQLPVRYFTDGLVEEQQNTGDENIYKVSANVDNDTLVIDAETGKIKVGNCYTKAEAQEKLTPVENGGIIVGENGAIQVDLLEGYLADSINSKLATSSVENELSQTSENPVQNKVVYSALQDKANTDDVYTKTETNQSFANSLTNTVSGNVIGINDISPIEHTININGTANDIVNCNSANLLPYPYNDTSAQNGTLIVTDNGDGTLTLNGTTTGRCYFSFAGALNPLTLISGATYTPTIIELGGSKSAGAFYFQIYADSTYHFRTFTLTDPTNIRARLDIDQNSVGMTFNNYKIGCMLVKGNTAPTTYEGYVSFAPVTLDENGQGSITSITPNMTFSSNNEISVTYNENISNALDKRIPKEKYELLIDNTTTEETTALLYTTDANGKTLNLKKVVISIELPSTSSTVSATVLLVAGGKVDATAWLGMYNGTITLGKNTTISLCTEIKDGYWVQTQASVSVNSFGTSRRDMFMKYSELDFNSCKSVKLSTSTTGAVFPIGTNIKVWGVEA